jgi:hypothetical protein
MQFLLIHRITLDISEDGARACARTRPARSLPNRDMGHGVGTPGGIQVALPDRLQSTKVFDCIVRDIRSTQDVPS